jgi:Pentapeptide repeats (8 copies)
VVLVAHSLGCRVLLAALEWLLHTQDSVREPHVLTALLLAGAVPVGECVYPHRFTTRLPGACYVILHPHRDQVLRWFFAPGQFAFDQLAQAVGRYGRPESHRWDQRISTGLGHGRYWPSPVAATHLVRALSPLGLHLLPTLPTFSAGRGEVGPALPGAVPAVRDLPTRRSGAPAGRRLPNLPESPAPPRSTSRAAPTRVNLTNATLAGADLAGADLAGADLTGADLAGADLTGADLTRADLAGADLTDATLVRATLIRATLIRATLVRATLVRATLVRATLIRAKLICAAEAGIFCAASTAAQRTRPLPCLVIGPRRTVVSDSPISATNTAARTGPTPGIRWITWYP